VEIDVLEPNEELKGYPSLQQGVVAATLGDLGVPVYSFVPVLPTQTPGEIIEFSDFGSDFEAAEEITISEYDKDGDGFIGIENGGTDCNDLDPTIYPNAFDPCGDNIDQDCDNFIEFPDGAFCQPMNVTLNIPDVSSRFICYNEDDAGIFAECCGYDLNKCYNQVPKGRRQGAVLTTIEEFQEGCAANKNCVQKFGLVPRWSLDYYSFDIPISRTDSPISDWTPYSSFEFYIYLVDDYAMDVMILGSQYQGDGNRLDDYTLLFYQPVTEYVVNSPALGKWMHVIIPINDDRWIVQPTEVTHILLYADTQEVKDAGGRTKATIAGNTMNWENVVGIDRFFLRPQNPKFCAGTNTPGWIDDLDDDTLDVYDQPIGKIACQSTPTFGWTGSKCCGDDTDAQNKEYFADEVAGCWNGEMIPNDHSITNIEYELTYQIPTYSKEQIANIPAEYETQEFEYTISYFRNEVLPKFAYSSSVEIDLSKEIKDFGDIKAELPAITRLGSTYVIGEYIKEYKGFRYCPANYVAIGGGTYGDKGEMQRIICAPLIDNIRGENIIITEAIQFQLDGESNTETRTSYLFCPEDYALCGFYDNKDNDQRFRFLYCCRMFGAKTVRSSARTIYLPQRTEAWAEFCGTNEVICGVRRPDDDARYYCCDLVTTEKFMIYDDNKDIDTYFEPPAREGNHLADSSDSHIMAVSDNLQRTGRKQAFEATLTGTRRITKKFSVTCKSDRCVYPLPGAPTYTLIDLNPGEYNLTIDEDKKIIIAERVPQRIKFYEGEFYGCFAPDSMFDYGVEINNDAEACDALGSHFCSPSQGWNSNPEGAPSAGSRDTIKSTPEEYSIQSTSCCPSNYCWNGTFCVLSEVNLTSLINPLIQGDNIWRCLDGNWSLSIKRYTWDYSQSGFCPTTTQCLVDPTGDASFNNQPEKYDPTIVDIPQCIETGQFIEDHFCFNGTWSSRTKLIALQLLDIANKTGDIDNYTLFCDNYKNTLADYDYLAIEEYIRGKLVARPPISAYTCSDRINYVMPCVNNFCVLKFKDRSSGEQKVVFGTSLNKPINDPDFSFLRTLDQPTSYCNSLIGTKLGFRKCNNNPNIWYADALNSVIFSRTGVIVGDVNIIDAFLRLLFNPITSIINYVVDVIAPRAQPSGALIDYNFTRNVRDFNQLYVNRLLDISIKGIIEEPELDKKFVTINYADVPDDICLAVGIYDRAHPPAGDISCTKEGDVYYIISDKEIAFDLWTDLTSQLRLKYSP